jgi:hypothetical protein
MAAYGAPELLTDGIDFDVNGRSFLIPSGVGNSIGLTSCDGGINLQSQTEESARGAGDGGISLWGNAVSIVLNTPSDINYPDRGKFSVWGHPEYWSTGNAKALFEIKSPENTAAFDSVNVTVTNGSLSVGGSPVLTAGGLNAALSTATPPTSWSSAYVARGNVSAGGIFAGPGATATSIHSFAIGSSSNATAQASFAVGTVANASALGANAQGYHVTASGQYSSAQGFSATASAIYSRAMGTAVIASGDASTAIGLTVKSQSIGEVVLGMSNLTEASANPTSWVATDALFRVGNGFGAELSDAITTRKHGETTLTNKYWKANSSAPLADPSEANDAGGSALVVDGHTTLNGKVTITAAQGDISMGIYQ